MLRLGQPLIANNQPLTAYKVDGSPGRFN